jgi:hypothetical protein
MTTVNNSPHMPEFTAKEMSELLPCSNFHKLLELDGWHPRSPAPDPEGRYYYLILAPCMFRLQRPDGSYSLPYDCEEGAIVWTGYELESTNGLPICLMPSYEAAEQRRNEILALRAARALSRACGRVE